MGITNKLPLLNSQSKIVKIVGYILYAFVILVIIGAMAPSNDKQQTNSTLAETEFTGLDSSEDSEDFKKGAEIKDNAPITVNDVKSKLPENISHDASADGFKLIQLKINPKSVFRSDAPLDTEEFLYDTVVSDLRTCGYRVLSASDPQLNAANKIYLKYEEEQSDSEYYLSNDATSPRIKGTHIRCEVWLKNTTTNAEIKKVIHGNTENRIEILGNDMATNIYLSAFYDFHEQLYEMIRSVFVGR